MNEQENKKRFLPIWILILMTLEIIAIVAVTITGMQDITVMHPDQTGASYLSSLYITRNFVAAAGLALATYVFRSYVAFFLMLMSRIATEIADFINSYVYERSAEILSTIPYLVVAMVVLPSIAAIVIWPAVRRELKALRSM